MNNSFNIACYAGAFFALVALGNSAPANAAIKTVTFNGYRPSDGDKFVDVIFSYEDSYKVTIPDLTYTPPQSPLPEPPTGGNYGTQCSPPTGMTTGSCYLMNTDNVLTPWGNIGTFTGYPLVSVSGKYIEAEPTDPTFNIIGLARVGSYEGGITGPGGLPVRIPHYISDNLIDPEKVLAISQGGGFSQGGVVLLTDNPNYSYHLFTDPITGEYAGCGSGKCQPVKAVPAPLPILGPACVFAYVRRVQKAAKRMRELKG